MIGKSSTKNRSIVLVLLAAFLITACGGSLYAAPAKKNPNSQPTSPTTNSLPATVDQQLARAKAALLAAGPIEPVEGQDGNILAIVQSIVNDVTSGVTTIINSSKNPMIARDGTITYGNADTIGNVTFTLTKKKSTVKVSIPVLVAAKAAKEEDLPDFDAEAVGKAGQALEEARPLQPQEGIDSSIQELAQARVDEVAEGVKAEFIKSDNPQVNASGKIIYGAAAGTGNVVLVLSKNEARLSVTIAVEVPAHQISDSEQVEKARQALAAAGILRPAEGTDSSVNVMVQAMIGPAASDVSVEVAVSENAQIAADGAITYGSSSVTGPVTFRLTKNSASVLVSVEVAVPAHLVSNAISCTALGMVRNDARAGQKNMALLGKAVRGGQQVLVDGVYYLKSPDQTRLAEGVIDLTGMTADAEFKLENGNPLFNIANQVNVHISNIKFTQMGTGVRYILAFAPNCLCDQVIIEGNSFVGPIRLMEFEGSTTINPAVHAFGMREMRFVDNTVENASYSFMRLDDMPFDEIYLEDNTVTNFDYTFFSSGISNGITYEDEMFEAKKLLVVRNNQVKCDDSWWGNPNNTNYYCFALFEGIDCIYEDNHVEGLKYSSGSGSGAAVYDAYLSCENLIYVGNTWKNILNFNPGKENNTLLKSKGGPDGSVTRHYEANHYIIEESYIKMCSAQLAKKYSQDPSVRLAQDLSASWIDFISLTTRCSTYEILDNTIDVYDLRLPMSSIFVEQMNLSGNQIKCKKIGGILLPYRVASNIDYGKKTHTVSNNRIEAEALGPAKYFQLIKGIDVTDTGEGKYGTIISEYNTVLAPCSYLLAETRVTDAVLKGNFVDFPGKNICRIYPDYCRGYIDNLTNENNTFS